MILIVVTPIMAMLFLDYNCASGNISLRQMKMINTKRNVRHGGHDYILIDMNCVQVAPSKAPMFHTYTPATIYNQREFIEYL